MLVENNKNTAVHFFKRANVLLCGFSVALMVFWGLVALITVGFSLGFIGSIKGGLFYILLAVPSMGGMLIGVMLVRKFSDRIVSWSTGMTAASFVLLLLFTVAIIPKPDVSSVF